MDTPPLTETIAAIATPPGFGGVGIVRVSGPLAEQIAKQLVKKPLQERQATYTPFYSETGDVLDHGIALLFKAPHSFTGDNVLELQGHGGPVVLNSVLSACVALGARLANPGEFSLNAFLNGKIDLTQAEAISDLIHASSQTAAQSAMRSLEGAFSDTINTLLKSIIQLRMYVESAIDFPEEEIDFLSNSHVNKALSELITQLEAVLQDAKQGVLIKEGVQVVIVGKPNVGKSSLLNLLSERESAIVTDVPGTTRDILTETIQIDGMPLHIVDTAGLRETDDLVEQMGVLRAKEALQKADLLLVVCDARTPDDIPVEIDDMLGDMPYLRVYNKQDLLAKKALRIDDAVYLSAKTGEGLGELKKRLHRLAGYQAQTEGQFIARTRHVEAIKKALALLKTGQAQLNQHQAGELLAEDLRLTQASISDITGQFSSDDLLGEIFSNFCIGK